MVTGTSIPYLPRQNLLELVQVWGLHALSWTQLMEVGISRTMSQSLPALGPQIWASSKHDFLKRTSLQQPQMSFQKSSTNPLKDFSAGSAGTSLPAMQEMWVQSLENPLEKEMATHSGILPGKFCPGKSHGQRSLAGYSTSGSESWT